MADTFKFKRGIKAKLPTLAQGEPAFVSDENELYIGTANGNTKLTSKSELATINSQLADIQKQGIQIGDGTKYGYFSILATRTTINYHAFEDWGILNTVDTGLGYCSFDSKATMNNDLDQDHFASYQARNRYNGSGNLNYMHGFDNTGVSHTGTGTIEEYSAIRLYPVGGNGQINNNYGIYIGAINRPGSITYAIYNAEGTCYFGGNIEQRSYAGYLCNLRIRSGGWKYGENGFGFAHYAENGKLRFDVADNNTNGENATAALKQSFQIDQATGRLEYKQNTLTLDGYGHFNNLLVQNGWKYSANGYGSGLYQDSGYLHMVRAVNNTGGAMAAAVPIDALTVNLANGYVGINTPTPSTMVDINCDKVRLRNFKTPASATDTGLQGDMCWDANYIYLCIATNTWRRIAHATW